MFPQLRSSRIPIADLGNAVTSSFGAGAIAIEGVSTVSWVGASTRASVWSAAGVGSPLWVSSPAAVLSSSGSGVASCTGRSTFAAPFTLTGTGVAVWVGRSTAETVWSASGVGTLVFTDDTEPPPPAVFEDLTTLFCAYVADIRETNPTRNDTDTLVVQSFPTVRNTTDSPDDMNTALAEYLS